MESATAAAPMPTAEVHSVPTSDGTAVRLTRYKFGTKGPLVMAPGYGNAARAFAIDTVPKNWVQYLGEHGYDVWLLDYRASPDLPSSTTQFNVDDIALRDWPAAVDTIRRETGQDSVQALGHCIGGLSLFMAMGGGMEGVRSATFSSLAGHPIPTRGNQLRAHARLATLFRRLGINVLDTDYDPRSWDGKLIETVMKVAPFRHIYDNPVARRIYFIYGDVFDYENINAATMEQRRAELLRQRQHHVLRAHLADDPRERRPRRRAAATPTSTNLDAFKLPINFITGEHNKMFVPKGLQRTLRHAAPRQRPAALHPPRHPRLRSPRPVAGHQRRARRVADRPR